MKSIRIENRFFRLALDARTGMGVIHHRMPGRRALLLARLRYLSVALDKPCGRPIPMRVVRAETTRDHGRHVAVIETLAPKLLRCSLTFECQADLPELLIRAEVESIAAISREMGCRACCLDIACDTIRARLLPGLFSGWSHDGRSIILFPGRMPECARQMTLAPDHERREAGDIRTSRQGMALNMPAGMFGGVTVLDPGDIWTGMAIAKIGLDDPWNPALSKAAEKLNPPDPGIQQPRHDWPAHVANWAALMRRDDAWVPLGRGMGMYHRGFYGMIRFGEKRISGPLRYNGLRCIGTGNERLIELAWGGSNNALLAYSLFHHGSDWAVKRARMIVKAATEFKQRGFQVNNGPCRGAWYNGFQPDADKFSDRYDRTTLYTPDQGIANYFLGRILLEKFAGNDLLVERIKLNCEQYLPSLENRRGGLEMARKFDGSPGVDRYELLFDGDKADLAMPSAMGALSHLVCFRLTGSRRALERGEALLSHVLEKVRAFEWRFHEYDTWGWDNMAMCWILVTLVEWSARKSSAALDRAIVLTRDALLSCQHRFDLELERYTQQERCWGGRMNNRGGFAGGTTVGSLQSATGLHNRFDPALALLTHYRHTGDARSYTALLEFLNYLTYHQWTRRDLPIGLGAVTEAMHLVEGHVQDTAQTLHSNTLFHIMLGKTLFLESSTADLTRIRLPHPDQPALSFTLAPRRPGTHRISIGGHGSDRIILRSGSKTVHIGSGSGICLHLGQPGRPVSFDAHAL